MKTLIFRILRHFSSAFYFCYHILSMIVIQVPFATGSTHVARLAITPHIHVVANGGGSTNEGLILSGHVLMKPLPCLAFCECCANACLGKLFTNSTAKMLTGSRTSLVLESNRYLPTDVFSSFSTIIVLSL